MKTHTLPATKKNLEKAIKGMDIRAKTKRMLVKSMLNFQKGKTGSAFDPAEFPEILKS